MTASSRQMQCRPWSWQHGCSIVHSHCWKSEPASRLWCVLCVASYEYRHGPPVSFGQSALFLAAILHVKKSTDELSQLCRHLVRSCRCQATDSYVNFDNFADAMYIVAGWLAITRQLSMFTEELEKPCMAIFSALAWLRLLYSFRGETWMGPAPTSHSRSHQRHVCFFHAHGHLHRFGSSRILQLAG